MKLELFGIFVGAVLGIMISNYLSRLIGLLINDAVLWTFGMITYIILTFALTILFAISGCALGYKFTNFFKTIRNN